MNLAALLDDVAKRRGNAPAVTYEGATLGYSAFNGRVAALAHSLRKQVGLAEGDRVGLAIDNSAAFLIALFAIWRAGLVAVPINAKLHGREVAQILENCSASLCLASPFLCEALNAAGSDCPLIDVTDRRFLDFQNDVAMDPVDKQPSDLAWIFHTSGTTGRSKGAMLTHRNLLYMANCYLTDIDHLDDRDTMLHAAPLSHGSGLYALPHMLRGSHQVILPGPFDAGTVIEALIHFPSVSMFAAPTMVMRLVTALEELSLGPGNLKTIVYGGAPMYVADLKRAISALNGRLYQIYAQGESPMTITGLDQRTHAEASLHDDVLGSCGYARTGVAVRVVDADDRALPAGELGEVLTRSDCVMAGYWGDSDATNRTLRGGWLHTGDIGALSRNGLLSLHDRSKDVIISGGSNIYPREIEEVLLQHPDVREVAVIGTPNREWGECVVAFVVDYEGKATADALDRLCLNHLARYKRPREYRFVPELPKNDYGKVLKRFLREQLEI